MIPKFPTFKLIELEDRDAVRDITSKFPPYSDFNFTSIWSWNLIDEIAISDLNENLVVRFTDYVTNAPFYSFIGTQKINETIKKLLDFSQKSGLEARLKLIPDVSVKEVDHDRFEIIEDRDHFDYVYSIEDLRDYPGGKFKSKRNHVNGFLKSFPGAIAKNISLKDPIIAQKVLALFDKWHRLKIQKGVNSGLHDLAAMKRLLEGINIFDLVTVGIFLDEKLVAIIISEIINSEYVLAHMMKADNAVDDGAYSYLMQENAKVLSDLGMKYFNFEQDLGMENLRIAKSRFNPQFFLKKFKIQIKNQVPAFNG